MSLSVTVSRCYMLAAQSARKTKGKFKRDKSKGREKVE